MAFRMEARPSDRGPTRGRARFRVLCHGIEALPPPLSAETAARAGIIIVEQKTRIHEIEVQGAVLSVNPDPQIVQRARSKTGCLEGP